MLQLMDLYHAQTDSTKFTQWVSKKRAHEIEREKWSGVEEEPESRGLVSIYYMRVYNFPKHCFSSQVCRYVYKHEYAVIDS